MIQRGQIEGLRDETNTYTGTLITGNATTGTVFSGSGIGEARLGDLYINIDTIGLYRCVLAGAAAVAKWIFLCKMNDLGDTPELAIPVPQIKILNGQLFYKIDTVDKTLYNYNPQIWLFAKTRIRNITNKSFKISHPVHYLADGNRLGVEFSTGRVSSKLLDYNTGNAVKFLYRHTEEKLVDPDYAWHPFSFRFADFFKTIYKTDGLARMVNQNATLPLDNYQKPILINRSKKSPMSQGEFYLAVAIENPDSGSWKKWLIGEYSTPFYARYEFDAKFWRPVLSMYRKNLWIKK